MTLPGFESIPATSAGGTFNGSPWRVVLHTTEGATAEGAVGAYRATGSWPHFTVDPSKGRKIQHYELNVSARALLHRPTDPETNRANAIQIEIVGFATASPAWPKAWLDWLGHDVLAPIREHVPFSLVAPDFVRYPDSYGFGAAQRFTWASWTHFSGIVGHEHVPGNDHGDPGALDVTTIIAAIAHTDPIPPPVPLEDDMVRLMRADKDATVFAVSSAPSKFAFGDPYLLSDYADRFKGQILPATVGGPTVSIDTVNGVKVEVVNPLFLSTIPTVK